MAVRPAGQTDQDQPDLSATGALVALAARLQAACLAQGVTVATAESCTGGLVAHVLTEVPGSSGYLRGGVVAYSDRVKRDLLDVPEAVLAAHGAVSAQTALAMAEGARRRLAADLAVSVTGIAGPDGGSDAKPVGLTYIAVAGDGPGIVRRYLWSGDRSANKVASARTAIELLLEALPVGDRATMTGDPGVERTAGGRTA